jgi:hypothetical protein
LVNTLNGQVWQLVKVPKCAFQVEHVKPFILRVFVLRV